jgi:DNA-binding CsgD family transcriptional regulator/tetratricopeptide (TPR) repeat protein
MEFVGRQIELRLLRSQFDEALRGHPRLALIEGPAGIGKTALVDRFLCEYGDVQVLRASGEESEALLEYGVVDQLLSSQAGPSAMPRQTPLEDHLKVGAQFLDLLGHLQERGPVILVIDDLHWADQTSLKALLFALRRLQADRVLALLVMRSEETHRLPEGLSRLIHSGVAARQQVSGLESADLRELAALMGVGAFSAGAAERLHQHTEGNPLYARALLAELPAQVWTRSELTVPAPHSFSLLVLSRRAQRSQETRQLLDAASVLGMHSSLDLAARLADIADPLAAVDAASAAGLLQIEKVGKREIAFPHPLVGASIYHGLSMSERARLHARAATLVDDQASSLRHRVAATPTADPQLAADLADFARREAGQGAWASAAAHLVKASRLSAGRSERERLLLEAVNWMLFSGSVSQAAVLREEISSFAGGALRDCILGQLALLEGRPGDAERLLANAWTQCDPAIDAELAATIALRNASQAMSRLRAAEAAEWARRALQLTRPGSPEASRGKAVLSMALAYLGRLAEAFAVLNSTELASRSELEDWALLVHSLLTVVEDELPNARADLARVAATALRQGSLQTAADALDWLATAEYYSGAWDDAILHGERALLIYTESERPYKAFNPSALVAVWAARGEWVRAEQHIREATTQPLDYEMAILNTAIVQAQLAAARSDHQRVLRVLQPVLGLTRRAHIDEQGFWPWQDIYADALVSLDRVAEADAFLRAHESLAAERGRRSMMAKLGRVRGRVEAAEGRPEHAESAFLSSLQHIERLRMPFEQARIQLAYGNYLRRLGRRREAAGQLVAAQISFVELGAGPYLERCERELAASGLTPRKRRGADRTRLTPQELSVARLVASGLTNREVAGELFLSTKTIEFHLSQIFDKFDITSRRQIAKHPQLATGT